MPNYKFETRGKNLKLNDPRRAYMDKRDPKVKITKGGVYMAEAIYEELGRPERCTIGVDEANKALKVEASEHGYKVRINPYSDGSKSYQIIQAHGIGNRKIDYYVGKLPLGLYKSLGGGVFEYDPDQDHQHK